MLASIHLIFPHQLFAESPLFENKAPIYLVEEHLFFNQYKFHKQKLAFLRACMKQYQRYLTEKGHQVKYIACTSKQADIRQLLPFLYEQGVKNIHVIDPVDNWLKKRIQDSFQGTITWYENPAFLNTEKELSSFFKADKKFFFQTSFYKQQRKKWNVLLDADNNPIGGKWTFDSENRKKYPKGKTPPSIQFPENNPIWKEAVDFTKKNFPDNPGKLSEYPLYPISYEESKAWLQQFFHFRFHEFGAYEDAIVHQESFLHHSVLSPLINIGLLTPYGVVDGALQFAKTQSIPINSTEGFVRQIIGWREFVRGLYICKGTYSRTQNFWQFKNPIPASFYSGTTGILPVDDCIKKNLKTAYNHHIERLMVLGNFMLLCEINPNDVYQWFMEMYIDAYDWVMVPNVYGMSQFADGGIFATKPYIGGSNYIRKMSNYPSGDWEAIWDGLYWRFIHKHQNFFQNNPRCSMIYHLYKKMPSEKLAKHLHTAENFLSTIHKT